MNRTNRISRRSRRARTLAALLSLVVPASCGFAAPSSDTTVWAGIHYNSAAPLEATVTPRFDVKKPPTGETASLTYAVTFKGGDGASVPGLFLTPAAAKTATPAVILLHGLNGNKEQMYFAAAGLAARGYSVLAIDIAGHGSRPLIDGKKVAELNLDQVHRMAGQTVADLRRAVDWLQTRSEVDKSRIGFVGISLGGILGGVFVSEEPRIKASALWAAGGDWGKLVTLSTESSVMRYRKSSAAATPEDIETVMSDVDPAKTIGETAPRPLLFLNGDKDTIVPVVCTDALFTAAHEPKERVTLPGGHIPDALAMMEKTAVWLDAHLKN